jgi:hypothetical protein
MRFAVFVVPRAPDSIEAIGSRKNALLTLIMGKLRNCPAEVVPGQISNLNSPEATVKKWVVELDCQRENGGAYAPPFSSIRDKEDYGNSLRTACWAWFEIDRAEIDSCWRVCRVSRLALSWFWSARARFAEPVCSVLMRLVVKSERT